MEITKHNICQHIEDILKSQKVRYSILEPDYRGCVYELYASSIEGIIQVEYNLADDNNYFCLQFYINMDSNGLPLYHSDWDNESNGDSVESEIEQLLSATKRINQGLSKIQTKIEQIKDICEEYNLEFENFIDILYDFDA